jgi:hypothetical protein
MLHLPCRPCIGRHLMEQTDDEKKNAKKKFFWAFTIGIDPHRQIFFLIFFFSKALDHLSHKNWNRSLRTS